MGVLTGILGTRGLKVSLTKLTIKVEDSRSLYFKVGRCVLPITDFKIDESSGSVLKFCSDPSENVKTTDYLPTKMALHLRGREV